jgi:muramidase (phage lysozyme)
LTRNRRFQEDDMFTKTHVLSSVSFLPAALALAGCSGSAPSEETNVSMDEQLSAPTCNPALANGAVPHYHRALLDTIATTEGTRGHGEDGYNVTYAYHYFSSCDHHPDLDICAGNLCSTAAGRYQFLYQTWTGLGYPSFHPDNQDRGAMKLVAQRGVTVPTTRAMTATEFVITLDEISHVWASLPPGRYGQPTYTMSGARKVYCSFAGCDGQSGSGGTGGGSGGGGKACSLGGHSYATNTCTETQQCDNGTWVARTSDASSCNTGIEAGGACLTDTGAVEPQNTCTSTLECANGVWVSRQSDSAACNCELAGHFYGTNTCTETLQCNDGRWVARSSDSSSCRTGIEANGACLTDSGSVAAQNTCTSTLQCDDGVWVDRVNDPSACL